MAEPEAEARDAAAAAVLLSLGRALALGEGFALHLVSVASIADADRAIELAEQQCRALGSVRQHVRIDPYSFSGDRNQPLDEHSVTARVLARLLFSGAGGDSDSVLWLDLSRAPGPPPVTRTESGRDDAVLRSLFRMLNERRNDIARDRHAPLVLLAPSRLMLAFAEEAPDFWSIRSLSLRMPPPIPAVADRSQGIALEDRGPARAALGPPEVARLDSEIAALRIRMEQAPDEPTHRVALARMLQKRSLDCRVKGQLEDALTAGEEALSLSRKLALADRQYTPEVASALLNLGEQRSALGDREGALEATREAVELFRQLATGHPDAFLPNLAGSLNNLGISLGALGDREGALEASREAVELWRKLASVRPDVFEPDLAMSLNNLGTMLSGVGDREGALEASREAVELYRTLAAVRPDAFMPDLAGNLNNLGNRLGELGDRAGALDAMREAVELYRTLAAVRPDAFMPRLARSLNNLSIRLSELGDHEAALEATREAVELYRQLAAVHPAAFLPDLAASLNNLGLWLSALGNREGAREATREAAEIQRKLAAR